MVELMLASRLFLALAQAEVPNIPSPVKPAPPATALPAVAPALTLTPTPDARPPSEIGPPPQPSPRAEIGYLTAAALAQRCQDSAPANITYCFAYIASVHDTMRAYEIWLGQREFCIPQANAQGDLRRAFLTYVSAYPQNSSGQAASVVVVALKQTYPCLDAPTIPDGQKVPETPKASGQTAPKRPG